MVWVRAGNGEGVVSEGHGYIEGICDGVARAHGGDGWERARGGYGRVGILFTCKVRARERNRTQNRS